jgi:hypothetical protein
MAVTDAPVEHAREDIATLRRRIVSEIVDLNHRLPGRKLSRRERFVRSFRRHSGRGRSLRSRLGF